ncbi:N-acetyl-gamma-glutamyl-phosphate reductase [Clostridium tepidiprofundi DSM 19306]|uniref:N-acetyl-gamma-glutamyl-phosphate reductase n=1 Tax=Clostridium tepidiprofundi DSM 19306 TaxID=1121338 RepID=A0A151B276_9CLOT|nr:N-acetyl-gamma-glutamyl-phosphate reductase [Clostridium tepidiprofundi]KYH34029.1 N-acetyl-gamma-glutamyl-phosphate reductase [Clostridium tepidiprofundi DSM 19306]
MVNVGILGATGYTGLELIRLLENHKEVKIKKILSRAYCGRKYSYVYRNFAGFEDKYCEDLDWDTVADGVDILFSALPYGVLMEKLTDNIMKDVNIIDVGVDYRFMNKKEYSKYYGKEHKSIELADKFVYGLSEWNEENIKNSRYVANPGCYASVVQIALLPLIKEGLIEEDLIVDGKCGLSGGGRSLTVGTHYVEANESIKAYRINNHPHAQEIKKGIEYFTGKRVNLTFTPHLVPMQRGMLITAYAQLKHKIEHEKIREMYNKYYYDKKFIQILDKGIYVETKWVKNSNMCHINFEINEETNKLIVVAAIDNLIKGASGQAIQNMNIMYGFEQSMGLNCIPIPI